MPPFEEDYLDVLQNLEFAIISVYREHSGLMDYEVEKVLNALIVAYQAEQQPRVIKPVVFTALAQQVYTRVHAMCEWRLGREALSNAGADGEVFPPELLSLETLIACLKRIRKSVQKWSARDGRQGYLRFVNEYIA